MSDVPRKRREVSRTTVVLLTPFVRYSSSRGAYVLRLVGNRHGPVLLAPPPRDRRRLRRRD